MHFLIDHDYNYNWNDQYIMSNSIHTNYRVAYQLDNIFVMVNKCCVFDNN